MGILKDGPLFTITPTGADGGSAGNPFTDEGGGGSAGYAFPDGNDDGSAGYAFPDGNDDGSAKGAAGGGPAVIANGWAFACAAACAANACAAASSAGDVT